MTARSPAANVPTREADCVLPSAVVTAMVDAPEMTWLLVTTSPLSLTTTPEPRPRLVWICTIEGRTRSTTATNAFCRSVAAELGAVPEDDFGVGEPGGEVAGWPVHPANTSAMSIAPKPAASFSALGRGIKRRAISAVLTLVIPTSHDPMLPSWHSSRAHITFAALIDAHKRKRSHAAKGLGHVPPGSRQLWFSAWPCSSGVCTQQQIEST